jgi:hypothetical protein
VLVFYLTFIILSSVGGEERLFMLFFILSILYSLINLVLPILFGLFPVTDANNKKNIEIIDMLN